MKVFVPINCGVVSLDYEDYIRFKSSGYKITGTKIIRKHQTVIYSYINRKHLSRVIMQSPEGHEVDHKDGNRLNNCKSNLRICSPSNNKKNKKPYKGKKTKGVQFRKRLNKYESRIRLDGKLIYLGVFSDENSAANAYNLAAIKYFGEFAKLNEVTV